MGGDDAGLEEVGVMSLVDKHDSRVGVQFDLREQTCLVNGLNGVLGAGA